jgi:hypothetical protein
MGENCTSEGVAMSWGKQCLSYSISERADQEPSFERLRDAVQASFDSWTGVTCGAQRIGLVIGQTRQLGECQEPGFDRWGGGNANAIIFVDWIAFQSELFGSGGATVELGDGEVSSDVFGVTIVSNSVKTGQILDADIVINEGVGPLAICNQRCKEGEIDIQNVVTHEAGHFLGLGHSDVLNATMSPYAIAGETDKRELSSDDWEGLCAAYGHLSEPACRDSDFYPRGGFSPDCAPASEPSDPPAMQAHESASGCSVAWAARLSASGCWPYAALLLIAALRGRRGRRLPAQAKKRRGANLSAGAPSRAVYCEGSRFDQNVHCSEQRARSQVIRRIARPTAKSGSTKR